ncbi:hypothetical protein A5662_24125 [Mycobacteriaceae bacterium 1482268.1]|nr:hypothetical protein A5662_24125 [Mycobacteriaceae bacterium 1482268.1]
MGTGTRRQVCGGRSFATNQSIHSEVTSGGDAWQSPGVCLALVQRYSAAFTDLDIRAAIDAIA